jgi:quercetin dioxygenase-like cupin family protein
MLVMSFAATSHAQKAPHPPGQNVEAMHFMEIPGMPTCSTGSVQSGDPTKGPSIILAKMATGCVIPWHWHTPTESLMMVSGEAHATMKDGTSVTLRAGGFAQMPSKHVHQFTCAKTCVFYVSSDGAFDLHYVDADGKETAPAAALKKVAEKAATPPK